MVVVRHRSSEDIILLRLDAPNLEAAELGGAYLAGAEMGGLACRGASLPGANLRGANLRDADLREVDLSGANLQQADLRGVTLTGARLAQADLSGADLSGADLRGVDLLHTRLADAVLTEVSYDGGTRWPEGAGLNVGTPAQPGARSLALVEWSRGALARLRGRRMPAFAPWRGPDRFSLATLVTACALTAVLGGVVGTQWASRRGAPPRTGQPQATSSTPRDRTAGGETTARPYRERLSARPPRVAIRAAPPRSRVRNATRRRRTTLRFAAARPTRPRLRVRRIGRRVHRRRAPQQRWAHARRPAVELKVASGGQQPSRKLLPRRERREGVAVRRTVRFAWGNPGFHYGSDYDIYRMHTAVPR